MAIQIPSFRSFPIIDRICVFAPGLRLATSRLVLLAARLSSYFIKLAHSFYMLTRFTWEYNEFSSYIYNASTVRLCEQTCKQLKQVYTRIIRVHLVSFIFVQNEVFTFLCVAWLLCLGKEGSDSECNYIKSKICRCSR